MPNPSSIADDREQQLNQALEALYFAFRAVVAKPDAHLADLGLARVHHRILYFLRHRPACCITDLLRILGVSKQYLNRPLKELLDLELIQVEGDARDKRVKRLLLTDRGRQLEQELSGEQRSRFERVFAQAGAEAESAWHRVMALLADPEFD
ncbi:MAG: MarR family transcriptional regulator [Methylococcaceae bacterium]|nr:MarR family transcriptional regulator [Methylococcaceae bacterium]